MEEHSFALYLFSPGHRNLQYYKGDVKLFLSSIVLFSSDDMYKSVTIVGTNTSFNF